MSLPRWKTRSGTESPTPGRSSTTRPGDTFQSLELPESSHQGRELIGHGGLFAKAGIGAPPRPPPFQTEFQRASLFAPFDLAGELPSFAPLEERKELSQFVTVLGHRLEQAHGAVDGNFVTFVARDHGVSNREPLSRRKSARAAPGEAQRTSTTTRTARKRTAWACPRS